MYLIWSFEHDTWWSPNSQGYTENIEQAGRYTKEKAGQIVTDSIFLDAVAIIEILAIKKGPPIYHPYNGNK